MTKRLRPSCPIRAACCLGLLLLGTASSSTSSSSSSSSAIADHRLARAEETEEAPPDDNEGGEANNEDSMRSVPRMRWDTNVRSGGSGDDNDNNGGVCQMGSSTYDALACFLLSRVQIQLPSQSFHSGIFHLDIDALLCANFTVSRLRARAKEEKPTNDSPTTEGSSQHSSKSLSSNPVLSLNINVVEMGAICTANYRTMGLGGSLTATVGQQPAIVVSRDPFTGASALDWTILVNSTTTAPKHANGTTTRLTMPEAIRTTNCQTQMQVVDLSFQGSISSHLVNVFRGQIASYVTTQINANLCPVLMTQVDPYVTQEIHLLEEWLDPYLEEASQGIDRASSDTSNDSGNHDWIDFDNDAPVVASALKFVNSFVWGDHLDGGFLRRAFPNVNEGTYRHCGAGFDGWNGILSALLGPSNDVLLLPIPNDWQIIEFDVNDDTHVRISLGDALQLRGMDHWTTFQLLRPGHLRQVDFDLSSAKPVSLDMHVTINVSSFAAPDCNHTSIGDSRCEMLTEQVQVSINASHADVRAAVEIGADRTAFQAIPVGAIIQFVQGILDPASVNSTRAVQCLFGGVDRINAKELAANLTWDAVRLSRPSTSQEEAGSSSRVIATFANPTATDDDDDLERDLDQLLNEVINRAVLHEYSDYVTAAVLGLSRGPLPQVLNQAIDRLLGSIHENRMDPSDACRSDEDLRFPNWVNFSTVDVLQQLNGWLDQSGTVHQLNDFVDCVVEFLTTALEEQFQLIRWNLGENATSMLISLRKIQILNAGSLRHVRVMRPQRDGTYLSTGLSYGSNTTFDDLPRLELVVDMSYPPLNFTSQLNFSVAVNDLELGLGTILSYDLNELKSTLLQHIARHGECLVAPADQWDWIDPEGRLGFVALSFNATARALTMDQPMFLKVDSEHHPSIREFCINLEFWTVDTIRDVLRSITSALQAKASRNCGGNSSDDGGDARPSHFTSLLVIMAAVLLLAQPAVMLIQHKPQLPDDYLLDDENDGDGDGNDLARPLFSQPTELNPNISLYDDDDDDDESRAQEVNVGAVDDGSSLMKKNRPVRSLGIPVALLMTAVLTLSSHMSSIATVDVTIVLGGRQMSFPELVDINPLRLVNKLNHVGFNPLFVAVGMCSGALPYARLFLLLQAWASSYRVPEQRGRLLEIVDGLGKYAYVEVYVVFLAIILFRCHASVDENHVLDVVVSPKFGLVGFWLSSLVATGLGHAILSFHRLDEHRRRQRAICSSANRRNSSILTHKFTTGDASSPAKRQLSRLFYGFLLVWVVGTLTLLGLGLSSNLFTVQFKGWASEFLLRDFATVQKSYSLLSLGSLFPDSVASPTTNLVTVGLTAFYFVTVLVMPLACLVLLGGLLVVPLSLERQMSLLSWCEVARSWSTIEVTLFSVLLSVWHFPGLVNGAVQSRCDTWLQSILAESGGNDPESISCFRLETSVENGAGYVLGGALLHTLLVALCLRLARQAIEERLHLGDDLHDPNASNVAPLIAVQFWARCSWVARLVWAPPNDHYRLLDPSSSSDGGPPLQGQGGVSGTEPWQVSTSFEEEWTDAAERDPEWKEWKDATMVT